MSFSQAAKKRLTERIVELFKSFRNEIIMVQNKCCKFWHFEEVRLWSKTDLLQDCIIARYKDGYWACLVKKGEVNEAQIQQFYNCCRTSKYKIRKIIIVALKELDLNARLMALEKKIWIWLASDLNLLFDLYGQEQIAV